MNSTHNPAVRSRVLHVTETFSSGVATAVHSFVENAPQADHYLIASVRDGAGVAMSEQHGFIEMADLPRGMVQACREIMRTFQRVRPDHVHVHCAYAGVYVRLLPIPRSKIIYSPHCFPFERLSDPGWMRAAYRTVESLLAFRTDRFGSVSRAEAALSRELPGRARVIEIPNVSHLPYRPRSNDRIAAPRPKVAFNGRLSEQKDPMFVVDALARAPELARGIDFTWIGGGEPRYEEALRSAGVRVTGWLPLDAVQSELRQSDVYVHTASWEGFPMSVLEAAALDVPVLARHIRAFDGYGFPRAAMLSGPSGFIDAMQLLVKSPRAILSAGQEMAEVLRKTFHRQAQAEALRALYRSRPASCQDGSLV